MVTKENIGFHQGAINNLLSFNDAYQMLQTHPGSQFATSGNNASFTAEATTGQKGEHSGERVIIFRSNNVEMARAYECCWGHQTNCNKTYIDCYTQVISA